jgi:N-acetylated-alpha-linked acidic dipeptidase
VLPVSYADAQPLLAELRGRVAPPRWRGGLPITYHAGPGPAKVRLKAASNWDRPPLYNVIARMTGSEFPDEWVLRGNHHDAWVHGADDPVAGLVAMLEEARAFGELRRQGWRPRRTLVFCAWDGEEPGLLGSTEWVEAHTPDLLQHAVAYFNTDSNGRGFLMAEGSHALEKFVNEVARDITDPEKKVSIGERRRALDLSRAHNPEERRELREHGGFRIGAMGDGSDYTAFIHHLGIPSVGLGFGGESKGGVYHSVYDDFSWYTRFGDPEFAYGRALSETMGTAMMRLAGADLLPFDFTGLADTVKRYVSALQKLLKTQQEELTERNAQIAAGVFEQVNDPREPLLAPPAAEVPRHFNFAPLQNAAEALATAAGSYAKALAARPARLDPAACARINRMLMASGPRLTDSSGLPRRPWFRNMLWAPGAYTGYESKPLPAIQEAMDRKDWQEAESQIPRTADAIEREAALVREIAAALEAAVR